MQQIDKTFFSDFFICSNRFITGFDLASYVTISWQTWFTNSFLFRFFISSVQGGGGKINFDFLWQSHYVKALIFQFLEWAPLSHKSQQLSRYDMRKLATMRIFHPIRQENMVKSSLDFTLEIHHHFTKWSQYAKNWHKASSEGYLDMLCRIF